MTITELTSSIVQLGIIGKVRRAALVAVAVVATMFVPVSAQAQTEAPKEVVVELNKLEQNDAACRAYLLLRNRTEREFSVFERLVRGEGVNDIALHLAISNKTVSTHKARLMQKLGAHSMADLVRYAMEHRLV